MPLWVGEKVQKVLSMMMYVCHVCIDAYSKQIIIKYIVVLFSNYDYMYVCECEDVMSCMYEDTNYLRFMSYMSLTTHVHVHM